MKFLGWKAGFVVACELRIADLLYTSQLLPSALLSSVHSFYIFYFNDSDSADGSSLVGAGEPNRLNME